MAPYRPNNTVIERYLVSADYTRYSRICVNIFINWTLAECRSDIVGRALSLEHRRDRQSACSTRGSDDISISD